MTGSSCSPIIYCALDTPHVECALALAAAVGPAGCGLKLGLEFFNAQGPQGVASITAAHPDIPLFLDLKFHDIPNTVAAAVRSVAPLGASYVNVHAAGGAQMMRAAKEAALQSDNPPKILGVSILTALEEDDLVQVGYRAGLQDRVVQMAKLAQDSGLDGVVCSAHEIAAIRESCGDDFILMVPGIRPAGSATGDQKRIMTPAEALGAGANHLVIGRPITQSDDPAAAARAIIESY